MSRPSSSNSARVRRSVTSPNSANPESIAPSPTARVTRPPDRLSSVAVSLANFHGRIRDSGVNMVPRRMRSVRIAAAVRQIQASTPQTGSQTKNPSQPARSASSAVSAAVRASPRGSTKPYLICGSFRPGDATDGRRHGRRHKMTRIAARWVGRGAPMEEDRRTKPGATPGQDPREIDQERTGERALDELAEQDRLTHPQERTRGLGTSSDAPGRDLGDLEDAPEQSELRDES